MMNNAANVPAKERLDILGYLEQAWVDFVNDWSTWVLIGVIAGVLKALAVTNLVMFVLLCFVYGPLVAGVYYMAFAKMHGRHLFVGMLLEPFRMNYVPLVLVGIFGGALQALGLLLCGVGYFLTFPLWMFGIPLVLDRGLAPWDALEQSRLTVQARLGDWVLFGLVIIMLNVVGVAFAGIGLVVTLPVSMLMLARVYRETFGLAPDAAAIDSPPPGSEEPAPPGTPDAPDPSNTTDTSDTPDA